MNKILALSSIAGILLFTGCSKSTAFDFFSTDSYYEKSISNMQKASLMRDMETKALLHAVYLNNVDPKVYSGDEYFYVTVHIIEDAYDPKKHGLRNLDYTLKMQANDHVQVTDDKTKEPEFSWQSINPFADAALNESNVTTKPEEKERYVDAIEITELQEYDKLRRTMPVQNQWNHFYLVKFQTTSAKIIKLKFENDRYGKALLIFQKEK